MTAPSPAEVVDVRPMTEDDREMLEELLLAIPAAEHQFVKHDISDRDTVRAWLQRTHGWWNVAVRDGALVGAAAVVPGHGWSAHVGEIRMYVAAAHRGAGIGTTLARAALVTAIEQGCLVVTVQALAEQTRVLDLFRGLGFVPEALLTDHVREPDGQLHDLVVLTHSAAGAAAGLHTLGDM
jgi:RimJ/RimL family protein N-acetyltransferase